MDFTAIRRKPHYVDLLTPRAAGVVGYKLNAAANFDASASDLFTATILGYIDPALTLSMLSTSPAYSIGTRVRMTFDPSNYSGFAADDMSPFWIRIIQLDSSGSTVRTGSFHLIEPYVPTGGTGRKVVVVKGTAPTGAALANSQELFLPSTMGGVTITNTDSTRSLAFALTKGGPEVILATGASYTISPASVSVLYVRGVSGTATFTAAFTAAQNLDV